MLTPINPKQWDVTKAGHLLNRAGFGGTPEQIEALYKAGFEGAIQQMLNGPDDAKEFPKPDNVAVVNYGNMRQQMMALPEADRKQKMQEMQKMQRGEMLDLVDWWLKRMAGSPFPLREKLTLFWHGHFATSAQKVKESYMMWQQNETLRQYALGNFNWMVKAISRDPAMMVYLDTRESRKDHPNENFARELMELFTLGIGNYTEDDIQQSARAFTGYRINPEDSTFHYMPMQHDDGEKKFFGKTGNFGGDDIINMITQKPVCAQFISKKIWTFFAYENPNPTLVQALASSFQNGNYEIKPLMQEIFRSAEFYSPSAVRMQIKSPIQWMIQTSKVLETDVPTGMVAMNTLRQLGQMPFAPPNVKGWDGGKAWITTSTLLYRYNLSNFMLNNGAMAMERMRRITQGNKDMVRPEHDVTNSKPVDLAKIAPAELRSDPAKLVASLSFRLFQTQLPAKDSQPFVDYLKQRNNDTSDQTMKELLHLMMSTPQYQLT